MSCFSGSPKVVQHSFRAHARVCQVFTRYPIPPQEDRVGAKSTMRATVASSTTFVLGARPDGSEPGCLVSFEKKYIPFPTPRGCISKGICKNRNCFDLRSRYRYTHSLAHLLPLRSSTALRKTCLWENLLSPTPLSVASLKLHHPEAFMPGPLCFSQTCPLS